MATFNIFYRLILTKIWTTKAESIVNASTIIKLVPILYATQLGTSIVISNAFIGTSILLKNKHILSK